MPEDGKKDIIKELIIHINSLEEKVSMIRESLAEVDDLITVNKLDVINLRNDIEKVKLSVPEVSPDILGKLRDIERMSGGAEEIQKWRGMEKDIEIIKKIIGEMRNKNFKEMFNGLELHNQRIIQLESEDQGKIDSRSVGMLDERIKTIEDKTSKLNHCKYCHALIRPGAKFCPKCGKVA